MIDCVFCDNKFDDEFNLRSYLYCSSCNRYWFRRLLSGGFSNELLEAIKLLIKNNLLAPVIPAYLSVLELQLSIVVGEFLKDGRSKSYYAELKESDKQIYDKGVDCFLTQTDTNQLLAVIACMSDNRYCATPRLKYCCAQCKFDNDYAKRTRSMRRQPSTYVNNLPDEYRSNKHNVAHSLHYTMADFEKNYSKPPDIYSRYDDARTMRNRIVHADHRKITSVSNWSGMKSFSPSHLSEESINFVKDTVADFIDFLTILSYNL